MDNVVSGVGSVVVSILPVTPAARVQFPVMAGMVYLHFFAVAMLVFYILYLLTTLINNTNYNTATFVVRN